MAEGSFSELQRILGLLRVLHGSAGWAYLKAQMQQEAAALINKVMNGAVAHDATYLQEFEKGVAKGILGAIAFPENAIAEIEETLKQMRASHGGDEDDAGDPDDYTLPSGDGPGVRAYDGDGSAP